MVAKARERGAPSRTRTAGLIPRAQRLAAIALYAGAAMLAAASSASAAPAQPTPYPGGKWSPPAPAYGVLARMDQRVRMSDGAEIPVDVYVPADPKTGKPAAGRFPVIMTRTWYTNVLPNAGVIGDPSRGPGGYFVERGYIFVSADVRGTGRSRDAGAYADARDARDGVELVKWTTTLPGSNGVVGLVGCSGLGLTQLDTAAALGANSPVKAMIPACVPGDQLRDTYSENGVWTGKWTGLMSAGLTLFFGPGTAGSLVRTFAESEQGGDAAFDRSWWGQRNYVMQAHDIAAGGGAILLWNGLRDSGYGGLELYAALQNAALGRPLTAPLEPDAPVSGRYQLILGDWPHGGGIDQAIELQWFDTWLKGRDTGLPTKTHTPIHVQDRVTQEWLNFTTYPMTDRYTALRLGAGTLSATSPAAGEDRLVWWSSGPDGRHDYTSEPFADGARLAGPIAARVDAASSNTDAQISFELLDVAPDGSSQSITHGMVLGSLYDPDPTRSWRDRAGAPVRPFSRLQAETPLKPGEVVSYEVLLAPTVWTIRPGHRLRLTLGTTPPLKDCQMMGSDRGCIVRPAAALRLTGGVYTVHRGGDHPSMVSLPLLPLGALAPVRSGTPPTARHDLPLDW